MAWFSLEISALTGKLGMFWYIPSHLVHFVDTLPSGDDGARVIVHNQMVSEGHKLPRTSQRTRIYNTNRVE